MQTSLELQPIPVEFRPLFSYLTFFAWLTFVVILLSIVGSLYILLGRLKFNYARLRSDHHFRLRFLLAIFLFINRSSSLAEFISMYHYDSLFHYFVKECENYTIYTLPPPMTLQNQLREYAIATSLAANVAHAIQASSVYCMMTFLLFLTLDRYKRIHMVLPGTWKYYYFKLIVILYSLSLCFICIVYGWKYIGLNYGNPHVAVFEKYRAIIELSTISSGMILYYYYTLRLILTSVRGVELSWKNIWNVLFDGKRPTNARNTPLGPSRLSNMDKNNLNTDKVDTIQTQKILVAIRMFTYFFIVIVIDLSIFTLLILATAHPNSLNALGLRHEDVIAFVSSWIVFHVLIIYELLDLFLKELKGANVIVQPAITSNPDNFINNIHQILDSSKEDKQEATMSKWSEFGIKSSVFY